MRGEQPAMQDALFRDLGHEAELGRKIKGETALVSIARGDAQAPEMIPNIEAECYPCGLNIRQLRPNELWQVSHTPTGYAVGPKFKSIGDARAFCHLVRSQPWNRITIAGAGAGLLDRDAIAEALGVVLDVDTDEARRLMQ